MVHCDEEYCYQEQSELVPLKAKQHEINVFPVPITNSFVVEGIEVNDRIQMVNINGELLIEEVATSESIKLNAERISNGMYILKIIKNSGDLIAIKITK
jgi:hypothetical protein